MTKAIEYYLSRNVDSQKIRLYLNETYNTDMSQAEINEAIENVQKAVGKRKNVQNALNRMLRSW